MQINQEKKKIVDVAVNFLFQLIFLFPLFLGMVMYANEFETKEKVAERFQTLEGGGIGDLHIITKDRRK